MLDQMKLMSILFPYINVELCCVFMFKTKESLETKARQIYSCYSDTALAFVQSRNSERCEDMNNMNNM